MRTLIIIPAYNEAQNILKVIKDLTENCPDCDYLVVNDGSTDNTEAVLREHGINHVRLPINLGIGGGVQTGYRYALEEDYDIAIQFDGDGQHDARYIPDMIRPLACGEADAVIGSRFLKKEGFQSSALRRFGIRFLSNLIYLLGGIRVYDVTSGMRAVNRKLIAEFSRDYPQDYPEPNAVLTCGLLGASVREVPVQMRERENGVSSISPMRSVYYMIKVSLELILFRFSRKKVQK